MSEVHIELAMHVTSSRETDKAYKKIESGDLSGSFWPDVTTSRMDDYRPDIVLSDSLSANSFFDPSKTDDEEWLKRRRVDVQYMLPPKLAEKTEKDVVLVGGDILFNGRLFLDDIEGGSALANTALYWSKLIGIGAGVGLALDTLTNAEDKATQNSLGARATGNTIDPLIKPGPYKVPEVSRRRFIRNGIYTGAGLAALTSFSPALISLLPTHAADSLLNVNEFLEPLMRDDDSSVWANGRTALMIQKGVEEAESNDAVVSVVMGSGHARNLREYLQNQDSRYEAIRNLSELLIRKAKQTSDTYSGMTESERFRDVVFNIVDRSRFRTTQNGIDDLEPLDKVFSTICLDLFAEAADRSIQ